MNKQIHNNIQLGVVLGLLLMSGAHYGLDAKTWPKHPRVRPLRDRCICSRYTTCPKPNLLSQ